VICRRAEDDNGRETVQELAENYDNDARLTEMMSAAIVGGFVGGAFVAFVATAVWVILWLVGG